MLTAKQVIKGVRHHSSVTGFLARSGSHLAMIAGFEDIAWQCVPLSKQSLIDIIRITKPESFVEIGVGKGDTFRAYLTIAETYTNQVRYIGFDTFSEGPPEDETSHLNKRVQEAEPGSGFWNMHHATKEHIHSIPDEYDVGCRIKLIQGNTKETLPDATSEIPPVDFIYIDGGHSYDTVHNDYKGVKDIIKHSNRSDKGSIPKGTLIVFDDFNCEPGVTKLVSELLEQKNPEFNDIMFTPAINHNSGCITAVLSF